MIVPSMCPMRAVIILLMGGVIVGSRCDRGVSVVIVMTMFDGAMLMVVVRVRAVRGMRPGALG